eukprot:3932597-Rhodomonas_salina.2
MCLYERCVFVLAIPVKPDSIANCQEPSCSRAERATVAAVDAAVSIDGVQPWPSDGVQLRT